MSKFLEEKVCPILFPNSRAKIDFIDFGVSCLVSSDKCVHAKIEHSEDSYCITFTKIPNQEIELKI